MSVGLALAAITALLIGAAGPTIVGARDAARLGWHFRHAPPLWILLTSATAVALALGAAPAAAGHWPRALLLGIVAGATPALVYFDVRLHRLPDRIVWPGIAAGAACVAAEAGRAGGVTPLVTGALTTAVAGGVFFLIIYLLPGSGLGRGDVKLAILLGLTVGAVDKSWAVAALLVALVSAGLAAVALVAAHRRRARDTIAYGPFLLFGAWTSVIGAGALSVESYVCCVG